MNVELKNSIEKTLLSMGCFDITFFGLDSTQVFVTFKCKELTSFKLDITDWSYTGIQLNPQVEGEYKIEFNKK